MYPSPVKIGTDHVGVMIPTHGHGVGEIIPPRRATNTGTDHQRHVGVMNNSNSNSTSTRNVTTLRRHGFTSNRKNNNNCSNNNNNNNSNKQQQR